MSKKRRTPIPSTVAAGVLFQADRTCCVCRDRSKRVQVHHIDDDPSNNEERNLAVLCLECHGDTQTSGGFGRRLDADQVILYRDDWTESVNRRRFATMWRLVKN
jgi:5-methylcytosine-specific restriction endonuclease McrA